MNNTFDVIKNNPASLSLSLLRSLYTFYHSRTTAHFILSSNSSVRVRASNEQKHIKYTAVGLTTVNNAGITVKECWPAGE